MEGNMRASLRQEGILKKDTFGGNGQNETQDKNARNTKEEKIKIVKGEPCHAMKEKLKKYCGRDIKSYRFLVYH